MFGFDTSELIQLGSDLGAAPARAQKRIGQATAGTAGEVKQTQQSLVPVLSGHLQSRITVDTSGMRAEVGPEGVDYDVFVEFGTSVMPPQPFVGPSADRHEAGYVDAVGKAAEDSIFG